MKLDLQAIAGFDWDSGNYDKTQKHGVTATQIADFFGGSPKVLPDLLHSEKEERFIAYGVLSDRRGLFVVFTIRMSQGKRLIRPISARFMHRKELTRYVKENP